jgi:hypothetical protein
VPELGLEQAAELGEGPMVEVECLDDESGAPLELGRRALDVDRAGERRRPPRDVARVAANADALTRLDEPESGIAESGRAQQPFGFGLRD